jgi:hypothetical protein
MKNSKRLRLAAGKLKGLAKRVKKNLASTLTSSQKSLVYNSKKNNTEK